MPPHFSRQALEEADIQLPADNKVSDTIKSSSHGNFFFIKQKKARSVAKHYRPNEKGTMKNNVF